MQKSNRAILIGLLMAMCLVIPSVMATTTLNVPVTGTNYTTINFNCTTDIPVLEQEGQDWSKKLVNLF